jgi:spore photoproduct lyase
MYVCVSYDADLLAMEPVTGYVALWSAFAAKQEDLKLEIRTKSAHASMWEKLPGLSNVIYAFTVSPQPMIDACEHNTPSAEARLRCACMGLQKGYPIRLCFDPMLYLPTWRDDYANLLTQIDRIMSEYQVDMRQLTDVSVGTFRISSDYMKKIRRMEPDAPAIQFPYVNRGGVYQYPPKLRQEMEDYLIGELGKRMEKENIYHE